MATIAAVALIAGIAFAIWPYGNNAARHFIAPPIATSIDPGIPAWAIERDPNHNIEDTSYGELAAWVYHSSTDKVPQGWRWTSLFALENRRSGFFAEAFQYTNGRIVLAYRGTDPEVQDFLTDLAMAWRLKPTQFRDAEAFFFEARKRFPNARIDVTGHSLGGSLAQYIAAKHGVFGVTFNAFGVARMFQPPTTWFTHEKEDPHSNKNMIFNFFEQYDIVSFAAIPLTMRDAWQTAWQGMHRQMPHQVGCKIVDAHYWRESLHRLQLHSVAEIYNRLLVEVVEDLPPMVITECPN